MFWMISKIRNFHLHFSQIPEQEMCDFGFYPSLPGQSGFPGRKLAVFAGGMVHVPRILFTIGISGCFFALLKTIKN
jgi:hypothetical protein